MTAEENQPPTPRKKRRIVLKTIAVLFGLVVVRVLWLGYCLAVGGRPATISKETTYVLGPVRADGTIDYLAALNERASQGVTPENNAAVPLLQVLYPAEPRAGTSDDAALLRILNSLGATPLPANERYHECQNIFIKMTRGPNDDWRDDIAIASKAPWSADRFPWLVEAIRANDAVLDHIVKATERPKCYMPHFTSGDGDVLIEMSIPEVNAFRDACRLLTARAMYRLGQGEKEKAANDLLACHRLARLLCQGPFIVTWLRASLIDQQAARGDANLAHYGGLSRQQLADYRRNRRELHDLPALVECIFFERIAALDSAIALADGRRSLQSFEPWITTITLGDPPDPHGGFLARLYDIDEMLRITGLLHSDFSRAVVVRC